VQKLKEIGGGGGYLLNGLKFKWLENVQMQDRFAYAESKALRKSRDTVVVYLHKANALR
jgi:hypothetical protein